MCALTVLSLAPFCGKAFHIDDPFYIQVAQHITQHPLDYYGLSINWYGRSLPVYEMHVSPPLVPYFLASWGTLFGWSERSLHLACLLFAVLFITSAYSLAARLCKRPILASLVTLYSPIVLVSATNIMLDLPMAAFFVAAVAVWCKGIDSDQRWLLVVAGLAAALSTMCKYFGIALVPLLGAYALARHARPRSWLLPLAIPILCLAAEQTIGYALYHRSIFANAVDIAATAQHPIGYRLATGLSFMGGGIIGLAAFALHMRPRRRWAVVPLGLTALAGCAVTLLVHSQTPGDELPLLSIVQLAIMVMAGIAGLALIADDLYTERSPASLLLACWVLGTFVFAALNWSVTARILLPLAPPVAILIVRRIERSNATGRPAQNWTLGLAALACACVSFAVGAADYVWAGSIRGAADSYIRQSKNQTGKVYFQGHWGWQFYLERGGLAPLDTNNFAFRQGDFVISPQNNVNVEQIPARYAYGVETTEFPTSQGLAINARGLGAGFYSDIFGPLPYAFGRVPADPYHVILLGPPKDSAILPN